MFRIPAIAAIGVVVVGGNGVAGLGNKDAARLQVVLQEVEDRSGSIGALWCHSGCSTSEANFLLLVG